MQSDESICTSRRKECATVMRPDLPHSLLHIVIAAFAACYQKHVKWYALLVFAVLWFSTALSFFMLPEVSIKA